MNKLFWLIYIQPLYRVVVFMILAAVLWGYLGNREQGSRRWRILNAAVFAGIAAVIFYMTVCARGEETAEAVLVPFQNFREAREQPELYRSMLMNVLLFFPIGLSLPFVLGKWKLSYLSHRIGNKRISLGVPVVCLTIVTHIINRIEPAEDKGQYIVAQRFCLITLKYISCKFICFKWLTMLRYNFNISIR